MGVAAAPAAMAAPAASPGSATFGGSGNTVTIVRLPVTNQQGRVTYRDVTIRFAVSPTGVLTIGPTTIVASPPLVIGNFIAGRYRNGGNIFNLAGPGVGGGGRTTWSVTGPPGCTLNAGWTPRAAWWVIRSNNGCRPSESRPTPTPMEPQARTAASVTSIG